MEQQPINRIQIIKDVREVFNNHLGRHASLKTTKDFVFAEVTAVLAAKTRKAQEDAFAEAANVMSIEDIEYYIRTRKMRRESAIKPQQDSNKYHEMTFPD